MGHASRSWGRQAALIVSVFAVLAALLPVAAAHAAAGSKSADGEIFVVAINAKQRDLDSARMDGLVDRLVNHTTHAPDAIFVSEIVHTNLLDLRDRLNVAMPDDVAHYWTAGVTTNGQLEGPFEGSNIKVKILVNSKTMKVGRNVQWHDKCTTTRTYQLITAEKMQAGGTLSHEVALAGVHFAPSFNAGGSVECKEQNAAEARRQMAAHADSGIMGDFNRRATTTQYECNPKEQGPLEAWYDTMTKPSTIDGRSYRDTVRTAHFGQDSMPRQWSWEQETVDSLCSGTSGYQRSRLDYIFVSDEMSPRDAGTDQGWGIGAPGDPACSTTGCKYSDHRFVWARVGISTHGLTPERPAGLSITAPETLGQLEMTWDQSTGATNYDVYRYNGDLAVRTWAKIVSTSATNYTDTGLSDSATYHYRVIATDASSHSRPSVVASATTAAPTPNTAPTVTIDAPTSGTHVEPTGTEPTVIDVAAKAGDSDGDAVTVEWSTANGTFAQPNALSTTAALEPGDHTLQITATDSNGATATDTVEVKVATNKAPVPTITSPEATDVTVVADSTGTASLDVAAEATDETPATVTWQWSANSDAAKITPPTSSSATATLPVGLHTLTVVATDAFSATGTDSVNVKVEPAPTYTDTVATGETAVAGAVTNTYAATTANDQLVQTISEESSGGKPASRHQLLEHRWSFASVPAGDLTVAADVATASTEGFVFSYSTDGGSTWSTLFTATSDGMLSASARTAYTGGDVLVRVRDASREGGESQVDSIGVDHLYVRSAPTEPPPSASPEAPGWVTATAHESDKSVAVAWADVTTEARYEIERTTDPAGTEGSWVPIATLPADTVAYNDTTVDWGTTYWYRVRAWNVAGSSKWTSAASTDTATAPAGPTTATVSGLTSESTSKPKGAWAATVTATVVDEQNNPVADATVVYTWSAGNQTTGPCTTDSAGQCSVTSSDLPKQTGSVTFTVTDVTASGLEYVPSSETSETVAKP